MDSLRNFLLFLMLLVILKPLPAQDMALNTEDTTGGRGSVEWLRELPSGGRDQDRKGTGEKIVEFVFGKRNTPRLTRPVAVLSGNPEETWVVDQENGVLFRYRKEVGEITHFRDRQYRSFKSLVGICSLPEERILFTDSYSNKIFVFTAGKKEVHSLNDSVPFERPTGIAFCPSTGNIWVVESQAHCVTILGADGNFVKRFGLRGTGPGEFNYPTSVWIDRSGKAYIVDALNFRIQIFDDQGNFISMFGRPGDVSGSFARPKGIATDSYGHIYVADALFHAVQIFDQSGRFLYSFGTQGQGKGEFWMPSGLYIDGADHIYVADSYNSRVQVFKLNYTSR
jgi:DNA-binding beta-propeller fold protein YncE